MEHFRGKRVLVTGGSSGIGKAAAKQLASYGAHVWIVARNVERLETALDEIRAAAAGPDQVFGMSATDVSDRAAVKVMAEEALAGLDGLDVLINNAGIAHPSAILDTPDDVFESMMTVNYFGMVHVTRAFLPHFYAKRSGHICNVASLLGFMGIYGYTAYAASKYAITGFSDCLRQELIDYNVDITVVFPPDTDTPQLHEENKIKPPETKAIAGEVKALTADAVAHSMLKGIAKRRYHVLPGFESGFTYWAYRHMPGFVRWYIDLMLKKYRKAHPLQLQS